MRAGRLLLGLALSVVFAGALVLWANVEFRRHGLFAPEIFRLFLLVGLPAGAAGAYILSRSLLRP